MAKRDYYDVLGCSNSATDAELKKAYRTKAKELHPDRNADKKNAEEEFKAVNEAYEVLKDPNKKEIEPEKITLLVNGEDIEADYGSEVKKLGGKEVIIPPGGKIVSVNKKDEFFPIAPVCQAFAGGIFE